jgi:hypothetical protein
MTRTGVGDHETFITRARGPGAASFMPVCVSPWANRPSIGVEAAAAQS